MSKQRRPLPHHRPKQPQQVTFNPSDLIEVKCPKCNSPLFDSALTISYLSPLVNPQGQAAYIFKQVPVCQDCHTILPNPNDYILTSSNSKEQNNEKQEEPETSSN